MYIYMYIYIYTRVCVTDLGTTVQKFPIYIFGFVQLLL